MHKMVMITRNNPTPTATPAINCTFTWSLCLSSGELLVELEEEAEGGVLTTCHGGDCDVRASLGDGGGRGEDQLIDDEGGEDLEDGGGGLSEGGDGDVVGGEDSATVTT